MSYEKFWKLAVHDMRVKYAAIGRGSEVIAHMVYLHSKTWQIQWTVVCSERLMPCYDPLRNTYLRIRDRNTFLFCFIMSVLSLNCLSVLCIRVKKSACCEITKFIWLIDMHIFYNKIITKKVKKRRLNF